MTPKIGAVFSAVVIGYTIASSWMAKAEPDVVSHDAALFCRWLDADHSPSGIRWAISQFDEVPTDLANQTVEYALTTLCPEYLEKFQQTYDGNAKTRKL